VTYPAAWEANPDSGEVEDNPGLNGSMPVAVDELLKSKIVFDNIRSLRRNLNLNGMAGGYCSIIIPVL
jgi:hypothetical protein